jgi:hypothetical protein
MYIFPITL